MSPRAESDGPIAAAVDSWTAVGPELVVYQALDDVLGSWKSTGFRPFSDDEAA